MRILRTGRNESNCISSKQKWNFAGFLISFLMPLTAHAQLIDANQNPPGIIWKKIDTPHFEIVFPRELSDEGRRVAGTMEALYGPHSRTLKANRKRMSLFLTNQGVTANGYVALAPRKSEWFHQPPQGGFTGSGEWYRLLAAHEGRHMVQFDEVNTGFTRFAGWLAGESGVLGLSMFSVPIWWWEGDAVGMETALTESGRGRIPEFSMGIRTQLLSGVRFPYSKAFLGSYRDWTPNVYELGYPLVSHVKQKYGPEAWDRVIKRTSKWSFWPFAFSNALKRETGKGLTALYEETLSELDGAWGNQIRGVRVSPYRTVNREPAARTNYRFPQYLNDSTLVAQKQGFDTPWSWVALDRHGNENTLSQISPLEPGGTRGSAAAGKIAWDEAVPDIRWGARAFSSIAVMDARTGKTRRIAERSRYFNPSLSPDGKQIAAVEFGTDRECAIVLLDAETGRLVKRIPSPDNALIQSPSWSDDGRRIAFTFQKFKGKGIAILDAESGEIREALPPAREGISNPVLHGRYALFSSPKTGIDNIHALDLETGIEYQVTSAAYGAFAPRVSPDGKQLLFSNYSLNGLSACEVDFDPSRWTRPDSTTRDATGYAETLTSQEGGPMPDESGIPAVPCPIADYHPLSNLLNVHSWLPVSDSNESGLMFYSRDKLNTLSLAMGPLFNTNENTARFIAEGTYAGLFPMIDFGLSRGGRGTVYEDENGGRWTDSWTETSALLGLRIPLDLSRGIHFTRFQAGAEASVTRVSGKSIRVRDDLFNGGLISFRYRLDFSSFREGTIRDVTPRWGQVFRIEYRHTPLESDYRGSQFFSKADFYFPGMANHHGLLLKTAWERQNPDNYLFPSSFPFSRGYDSVFHERFAYASASYAFPLACPEWTPGSLAYLKRVKADLFYDYTLGTDGGAKKPYRSIGAELVFETHFFNILWPVDLGVRWVHRVEDDENRMESFAGFNLQ
jgi:hypothetical protein